MSKTLEVISKAVDLMKYTYIVTSNHKRYPKKYITLVQELQNTGMKIYKKLMEANRLNINNISEKGERIKLQTETITLCDEMSCFVQLSYEFNLIGNRTIEFWQKKISDIKYMTMAWRSKDKDR